MTAHAGSPRSARELERGRRKSGPCRVGRARTVGRRAPLASVAQPPRSLRNDNETRRGHGTGHGHALGLRGRSHLAPAARGRIGGRRASRISKSPTSPAKIAAQVPRGGSPDAYNPDDWMEPKEQRRVDDFIVYAMAAATQALRDADWAPKTYEEEIETGVLIGSGIGGLGGIYDASVTLHEKGPRRISPFFIPGRLINLASGQVSIAHQSQGPQSCRRHRLLDRRARHRRRGAPHRARRRQGDGRRRRRIGGQPPFARGVLGLPRAVDRASTIGRSKPRAPMIAIATAS